MGSERYSTLMGIIGEVVTERITEGELKIKTTKAKQGEESLET